MLASQVEKTPTWVSTVAEKNLALVSAIVLNFSNCPITLCHLGYIELQLLNYKKNKQD